MRPVKTTIRSPVLPKDLETRDVSSLEGLELEKCRVDGCILDGQRSQRVAFDGVRIVSPRLPTTKVEHLTWLDVLCERGDLSMLEWPAAKFTRVELRDCRLTGARVLEGEFDHVRIVSCQLDYASFSGARFRQVSFERCRLKAADFSGADVAGTSFVECDLEGIDLTGAKLAGADVSSSVLRDARVLPANVRGLVVNREQAAVLSQLFGLVVRDA
jgi:uncharacterized protein YjbI with pentapeptide repeats